MLPVEHSVVSEAFACGVPGFSLCGCPEVPGPPNLSGRNSHGCGTTKHRLVVRSLDGRAAGTLTYYDGVFPPALAKLLGSRSAGLPTGSLLSVHASPLVARRLRITSEMSPSCPILKGEPCGLVYDTALGAVEMVEEAVRKGVLDLPMLKDTFALWFALWEQENPPDKTPPYPEDADRDHAVSVWRTPDGECHARSGEDEASGGTFPEAVERLFQMLYPENAK